MKNDAAEWEVCLSYHPLCFLNGCFEPEWDVCASSSSLTAASGRRDGGRRRRRRRKRRGGGVRAVTGRDCKQNRRADFLLLGRAVGGGGGRCSERINRAWSHRWREPGAPSAVAAVTPDSINMELENIVANTVLLKAREGKDGDGALTAPLSRYPHRHGSGPTDEGMPRTWVF